MISIAPSTYRCPIFSTPPIFLRQRRCGETDALFSAVSHQTAIAIERQRTHEELRESERRCRLLFNQSGDAIIIHGLDGRILDVNRFTIEMLHHTDEEMMRLTVGDMLPESQADTVVSAIKTATEKNDVLFESRSRRAGGCLLNVEISSRKTDRKEGLVQFRRVCKAGPSVPNFTRRRARHGA